MENRAVAMSPAQSSPVSSHTQNSYCEIVMCFREKNFRQSNVESGAWTCWCRRVDEYERECLKHISDSWDIFRNFGCVVRGLRHGFWYFFKAWKFGSFKIVWSLFVLFMRLFLVFKVENSKFGKNFNGNLCVQKGNFLSTKGIWFINSTDYGKIHAHRHWVSMVVNGLWIFKQVSIPWF